MVFVSPNVIGDGNNFDIFAIRASTVNHSPFSELFERHVAMFTQGDLKVWKLIIAFTAFHRVFHSGFAFWAFFKFDV